MFPTEKVLNDYKLFWQYPVITEKTFYNQNKNIENFIGFPWATIIDKRYPPGFFYKILRPLIQTEDNITCCQHISFRQLIPLFKSLNITKIYSPHKKIGENKINGIKILPCPLYAVNIEDNKRNAIFKKFDNKTLIEKERPYLYSFQGAYNPAHYLTDIRKRIFIMNHPENTYIRNIGNWHFDNIVYSKSQNVNGELNINETHNKNKETYNDLLLKSRFSLCPSGSGPNSIRLWESLAVGSIPVVLADTLELPNHLLFNKAIVRIDENKLHELPKILSEISNEKELEMRQNCIKIYHDLKNNYRCKNIKM